MITLKKLKKCRKEANLTQAELGKLLNVSMYTVSVWERGQRMPEWGMLEKISELLGVSVYRLIDCSDSSSVNLPPSERSLLVSDFMAQFWKLDEAGRDAVRLLVLDDCDDRAGEARQG